MLDWSSTSPASAVGSRGPCREAGHLGCTAWTKDEFASVQPLAGLTSAPSVATLPSNVKVFVLPMLLEAGSSVPLRVLGICRAPVEGDWFSPPREVAVGRCQGLIPFLVPLEPLAQPGLWAAWVKWCLQHGALGCCLQLQ